MELLLHSHQVLNLDNHQKRVAIECRNGEIWVTSEGEYRDHILRMGKRYVPMTRGAVVIEAIHDSQVDIEENS